MCALGAHCMSFIRLRKKDRSGIQRSVHIGRIVFSCACKLTEKDRLFRAKRSEGRMR